MRAPITRSRWLLGVSLLVAGFGVAPSGANLRPSRQTAVIDLVEPTLIGSTIVQGPVLFTHDDKKMLKGEPCTRVYLLESGTRTSEELTAFHCIPISRHVVDKFTIRTVPNDALGFGCILTEYQFAGDAEGHGVPRTEYAH